MDGKKQSKSNENDDTYSQSDESDSWMSLQLKPKKKSKFQLFFNSKKGSTTDSTNSIQSKGSMTKTLKRLTTTKIDKNANWVFSTPDFKKMDEKHEKYFEPIPETWQKRNIWLRYLFFLKNRRTVRFTEDVVRKSEADYKKYGETMGKDRKVKQMDKRRTLLSTALHPEAGGTYNMIDAKTYRISPDELPYPPDWESWILGTGSNCCGCFKKQQKKMNLGFNASQGERNPFIKKYSDKFNATEQKLCRTLDIIEEFMLGNTRTVDFTLNVIGITAEKSTATLAKSVSDISVPKFNNIAAGVWFFTFAIEELFQNYSSIPSRQQFEELMFEFLHLCLLINRVARRTVIYSQLHNAFGETAMKRIKNAINRLDVESDVIDTLKVSPPIKLGQALDVKPPKQSIHWNRLGEVIILESKPNYYKITTRKFDSKKGDKENPWTDFSSYPIEFKLNYLKDFIGKLQQIIITLNTQMQFLTDDIFERHLGMGKGRRRSIGHSKTSFLSALSTLDVVMYRFGVFDETTARYEAGLLKVMESIATDVHSLIRKGENIIESIVEVRDMTELCVIYMEDAYGLNFKGIFPKGVQFNRRSTNNKGCSKCCKKCCWKLFRDGVVEPSPGFLSTEFFSTIYPTALQHQSMVSAKTGYEFALQLAKKEEKNIPDFNFEDDESHMTIREETLKWKLDPVLRTGGVWDDLSRMSIDELKERVVSSKPDRSDMPPAVAKEVKRREDFKKELNKLYAQGKVFTMNM